LLASSATGSSVHRRPTPQSTPLPSPPGPVRSELLAAWTNLILGAVTCQEG
jgi:hypothetical protein